MQERRTKAIDEEDDLTSPDSSASGWRQMGRSDIGRVLEIADKCHPDHPEDEKVFRERLDLFPGGCSVLERQGQIVGYMISHPNPLGRPVPLDTFLIEIPEDADVLYIHDLSIDLGMRGQGLASEAVDHAKWLARTNGFDRLALVAVNRSQQFWARHGFAAIVDACISDALSGYGGASSYMVCDIT